MEYSEEEIIIDAKEFINNIKEILNEGNNDLTKKVETDFYTLQAVLQGLLDLYNKEKEKNIKYKEVISNLNNDWVSKNEIKEKIRELENFIESKRMLPFEIIEDQNRNVKRKIEVLQELLEE